MFVCFSGLWSRFVLLIYYWYTCTCMGGNPRDAGGCVPPPPPHMLLLLLGFFCLFVREVGDVQWVPLLCVWKIDPKKFGVEKKVFEYRGWQRTLKTVVPPPPPPPPMVRFGFPPMCTCTGVTQYNNKILWTLKFFLLYQIFCYNH